MLSNGAPHPKWIQLFWENVPISDQSQGTVKYFGEWPLLPINNNYLCCVKFASKIALLPPDNRNVDVNNNDIGQGIDPYLQKLKTILIEMNYPIIDWRFFPRKDCNALVDKLANIKFLTKTVLSNINSLMPFMIKNNKDNNQNDICLSDENKRNLIEICAESLRKGTKFTPKMIDNLKELEIFERINMGENKQNEGDDNDDKLFVRHSDRMMMFSPTLDNNDINAIPLRFLHYIMSKYIVLKYKFPDFHKILGVKEMKEEDLIYKFIDEYMNNSVNYNNTLPDQLNRNINCYEFQYTMIDYLSKNWEPLVLRNNKLKELCSKTPLIPISAHDKLLIAPCELYDPSVPIFKKLFADDPVFPHEYLCKNNKNIIEWMIKLGMNHEINGKVFVKMAKKLESISNVLTYEQIENYEEKKQDIAMEAKYPIIKDAEIVQLSNELTKILHVEFNSIFSSEIFNQLSTIAFLPCKIPSIKSNKKMNQNQNENNDITICRPAEALLQKDYILSWTISPSIACKMPEMGLQHLKILTPPSINTVIAHCVNLSQINGGLDRWPFKDDPLDVFEKIIFYFSTQFKDKKLDRNHIEKLKNISFIPIGSRLLKASRLFMTMDGGNLSPFMFTVPRQFQSHEQLFKALGAKEKPMINDYTSFLLELYNNHMNKPLNINELNAVFKVIELICKQIENNNKKITKLLVPNELGILTWSDKCVYNNDTYLSSRIDRQSGNSNFNLVHSALKLTICDKLNILPLSKAIIEKVNNYKRYPNVGNDIINNYLHNNHALCVNIERIIRHNILSNNSNKYKYNKLNLPTKDIIVQSLNKLRIEYCLELNTKLMFKRLDVTSLRYKQEKNNTQFFFDKNKSVLYLLWPINNIMYCSIILSNCICNILNIHSPEMITALSNVLYIPNLPTNNNNNKGNDSDILLDIMGISRMDRTQNGMLRGISGAKITKDDMQFIQKQPFRKYLKNEIVAIINPKSKNKNDLIYANVIDVKQGTLNVFSKLTVKYNQNGDNITLSSNNVFSFKSNLNLNESNSSSNSSSPNKFIVDNKRNDNEEKKQERNDNNDGNNDDEDIDELMDTMNNMMNRAGLNIDQSKQDMMKENLKYRKNLEKISEDNKKLTYVNNELKTEIENSSNALTCCICQTNPVNRVLTKCGHLLCDQCVTHVRKCPECRKPFTRNDTVKFRNPLATQIQKNQ